MKGWGRIRRPLYKAIHKSAPWLHQYWPGKIEKPVFIVGCPRSGTSIFGKILAQEPRFLYLNEPRHIWCSVESNLDIWAYRNPIVEGILHWDADDLNKRDADQLARWFHLEVFVSLRRRLVEKLPLNVFRLHWINAMFPDAKFLHVIRHGRDVALSLAEAITGWFPPRYWETSRHYGIFCDYAAKTPELRAKLSHINEGMDNYPRGLLVWLCSVWEGRQAGHELGQERYLEVRYESLISDPEQELISVFYFLNEPLNNSVITFAERVLQSNSIDKTDPDPTSTRAIAGDLLYELGYRV